MDPQHRLLLETAWRAVEHSGTAPSALAGTRTGVFMGLSTHDYLMSADEGAEPRGHRGLSGIGTSAAAASRPDQLSAGAAGSRPSRSTRRAARHWWRSIRRARRCASGECDVALAGGVNLLISPATMISFSRARMLAPDGRCKTFDAAADGYVRGEGCGVVVVKRLDDAIRDGDRIRAVIRGSAVNQDGASGGLTVPNGIAQQRVIAEALQRAGVAAGDVDYLEAHGTGTSLGDPIEVQAAGAAFGAGRDAGRPLLIGSVKTNIGHLEAAAGIAGLIKVILSLEHEVLPQALALSESVAAHSVGPASGAGRGRGHPLGTRRSAAHRRDQFVRILRDQRARHRRGSTAGRWAGTAAPVEQPEDGRFSVLPLSARTPGCIGADWLTDTATG